MLLPGIAVPGLLGCVKPGLDGGDVVVPAITGQLSLKESNQLAELPKE